MHPGFFNCDDGMQKRVFPFLKFICNNKGSATITYPKLILSLNDHQTLDTFMQLLNTTNVVCDAGPRLVIMVLFSTCSRPSMNYLCQAHTRARFSP